MANSTTNIDQMSPSQAGKDALFNAIVDALSPVALYGRWARSTAGLTFGYYGGTLSIAGTPTQIANGTVTLAANTTNYIESDPATGAVSVNQTGFTSGRTPLYTVVTGASTATSWTDLRTLGGGGGISQQDIDDAITAHEAETDPHPQYQKESEKGAANGYAGLGSDGKVPVAQLPASATTGGTVTSVDLSVPGLLYTVSGNPVTGAGTLTFALKTQAKNTFLCGPASGADAVPTMRVIAKADLPSDTYVYDLTAFCPGVPAASALIIRVPVARAVNFAANFAGSIATATVAATASTVFTVKKNGATVGTSTFAAGATTATFTTTSGATVSLVAGDIISIEGPASPDATLANAGFVLTGTR